METGVCETAADEDTPWVGWGWGSGRKRGRGRVLGREAVYSLWPLV